MNSDPMWYFFVVPIALISAQFIVLAIILSCSTKIKVWWSKKFASTNYEDCYILSTASEIRARQKQDKQEQILNTKEKLLNQGSMSNRKLI